MLVDLAGNDNEGAGAGLLEKMSMKVALALIGVLAVGSVITHGMSKQVFLAGYLLFVAAISLSRIEVGLAIAFSAMSLRGVIRWDDIGNQLAAGFDTLLTLALVYAIAIRSLSSHALRLHTNERDSASSGERQRVGSTPITEGKRLFLGEWRETAVSNGRIPILTRSRAAVVCLIAMMSYIGLHVSAHFDQPLLFGLMVREYIVPVLFVVLAYYACRWNPASARMAFGCAFWTTVGVAFLNVYHYAIGTPMDVSRWVLHPGTKTPEIRTIFVFPMVRLNHILGLSSQGAGSTYYVVLAAIGFMLGSQKRTRQSRFLCYFGALVLLVPAFLSVSLSAVITVAIVIAFVIVFQSHKTSRGIMRGTKLVGLSVLVAVVVLMPIKNSGGRSLSVYDYGYANFLEPTFRLTADWTPLAWLSGYGLGLKSGVNLGAREMSQISHSAVNDRWLFVSFLQMGTVGFLAVVLFWLSALALAFLRGDRRWYTSRSEAILCGVVIAGFLGFAHGAAVMERLFSPLFFGSVGILLATRRSWKYPISMRPPLSFRHGHYAGQCLEGE